MSKSPATSLEERYRSTPLYGGNADYVEAFYEDFLADPDSVDEPWRGYFAALIDGGAAAERPHGPIRDALLERLKARRGAPGAAVADLSPEAMDKQIKALLLIDLYRLRGHQHAKVEPLGLAEWPQVPELDPAYHGLSGADMDTEFGIGSFAGPDRMRLRDLIAALEQTYCGTVGAEYMHLTNTEERNWIQRRIEADRGRPQLSEAEKLHLLDRVTASEGIERYLHTKYVGQKRFSLEGGESLIPCVDELVQRAGSQGTHETIIGMAHRGRINLLVNILGKSPSVLFEEFEGKHAHTEGSGDVKYHMGFSSDVGTPGGNMHVVLAFNPSHLEIVNPVVCGSVRARQERRLDEEGDSILPILIHGDAAFAGQGVVMETLQLSQARGFRTGGTVHVIVNNQVGFTISNPEDSRSTLYATDIAKMLEAPVFHVNGDDPEAVLYVTRMAMDYRREFNRDVVIDIFCYRRHGHNEADEPAVTQPMMYQIIRKHPTTRALYAQRLADEGVIDAAGSTAMIDTFRDGLDEGSTVVKKHLGMIGNEYTVDWSRYLKADVADGWDTHLPTDDVQRLTGRMLDLPEDLELHNRVAAIVRGRGEMAAGELPLDWGFCENLAYASLLDVGERIRLVGQDVGRGTFFHRHAVLHDQQGRQSYIPLQHLHRTQGKIAVIDSLLSEEAVMGFEYGFASADPGTLVIWEGQFGDFANGAQVVIDQFISSGETKWGRMCGLTLLLPHGYEGQGPEHSSARLERYLQLCAEHNMQVCVPSNPAQMFHMIRRQQLRPCRKPLIVLTPKSLLRHKLSTSSLSDLTDGSFQTVISEVDDLKPAKVKRIVFCSGKVYYDLLQKRREAELDDVAIVRIEQLYPFPRTEYAAEIARYTTAREVLWCQEEPMNQGAWYQIHHRLLAALKPRHKLLYAGREASAAPAAGYMSAHVAQQTALVDEALGLAGANPITR
jgi:2-oxoglutarate dehydrogenase E1 component